MPAIELLLEEMYEQKRYKDRSNGLLVHLLSDGMLCFFNCAIDYINTHNDI